MVVVMDIAEAQKFVSRERAHWWLGAVGLADGELLLRRERLHNALAMGFAFALLFGYFLLPTFFSSFGDCAAIYLTWGSLTGFFYTAVQQGVAASQCRMVREFLEGNSPTPPA